MPELLENPEAPANSDQLVDNGDYSVLAADIAGAHGVSGSLRLRLIAGTGENSARSLQAGQIIRAFRASDGYRRDLTLANLRKQPQPKGAWIAHFKEVKDRNEAETLHGCSLLIREDERAVLPEGEFYVDQLLGLPVVTDAGKSLGLLTDVLNTPANDVYVTDGGALIPVADDFIVKVDLEAGRIVVRDVPGLLDEPEPKS